MKKEHLPILFAIALPIIFILVIALVVFLPSITIKPSYNIVYTHQEDEYYYAYNGAFAFRYEVVDGKIVTKKIEYKDNSDKFVLKDYPTLYLYDVKTDTSKEISLEEAYKLTLDPGPSSPDGYTVQYKYGHDGIFEIFGSDSSSRGYVISKGNASKKIHALNEPTYGPGRFKLLGWVK